MKTIQEKRLKAIEKVLVYIKEHGRAENDNGCCYYLVDNGNVKKCGVGALLSDTRAKAVEKATRKIHTSLVMEDAVFALLPETIKELGKGFLVKIQNLHDVPYYWTDKNELSASGLKSLGNIKQEFCNN